MAKDNWTFDIANPKVLAENADCVLKVRITDANKEAEFLQDSKGAYSPVPGTKLQATVLKILHGNETNREITIYNPGGKVLIKNVIAFYPFTHQIENMGLNALSDEIKNTNYISFKNTSHFYIKPNEEYVFVLKQDDRGNYHILGGGYGVFRQEPVIASTLQDYKNVLTGIPLFF